MENTSGGKEGATGGLSRKVPTWRPILQLMLHLWPPVIRSYCKANYFSY